MSVSGRDARSEGKVVKNSSNSSMTSTYVMKNRFTKMFLCFRDSSILLPIRNWKSILLGNLFFVPLVAPEIISHIFNFTVGMRTTALPSQKQKQNKNGLDENLGEKRERKEGWKGKCQVEITWGAAGTLCDCLCETASSLSWDTSMGILCRHSPHVGNRKLLSLFFF